MSMIIIGTKCALLINVGTIRLYSVSWLFVYIYICIPILKCVYRLDSKIWTLELNSQMLNIGFLSKPHNLSMPQFPCQQIEVAVRIKSLFHIKCLKHCLILIHFSTTSHWFIRYFLKVLLWMGKTCYLLTTCKSFNKGWFLGVNNWFQV